MGLKRIAAENNPEEFAGFRRTLVGLKLGRDDPEPDLESSFRRTLVGLKQPGVVTARLSLSPFQTNPRGVEAFEVLPDCLLWVRVSDEPS